jgi:hypothetical protein
LSAVIEGQLAWALKEIGEHAQHRRGCADLSDMTTASSCFNACAMLSLPLVAILACHEPVLPEITNGATDGSDVFPPGDFGGEESTGEPSPQPHPTDFCTLKPDETAAWERFVCSGEVESSIWFEYHGDPDVPIDSVVLCADFSVFEEKSPSYVYTCAVQMSPKAFGHGAPIPYAGPVDACCLGETPPDFVEAFCEIDAAEEMCVGLVYALDELRAKIPKVGKGIEVYKQLTELNKFMATNSSLTNCSKELAQEILGGVSVPDWSPGAPDPTEGWPWFRAFDFNVTKLDIEASATTGDLCVDDPPAVTIQCGLAGAVAIAGPAAVTTTNAKGAASFGERDCDGDRCELDLVGLDLSLADFSIGSWSFGRIQVALAEPARGRRTGSKWSIPGHNLRLNASFTLGDDAQGATSGEVLSVEFTVQGDVTGSIDHGQIVIESLEILSWPLELKLADASGACQTVD